ncbi:MAG: carbon-nitrogen hydrolase family protein [Thermoplasmata archaeon]
MKIVIGQVQPELGKKERNLEKLERVVSENECDLAVFGELYLTGYMCRDDFTRLAEELSGPSVSKIKSIAKESGIHIVFGMPETDGKTRGIYNSSVLVTPEGGVYSYRKLHLADFGPFEESLFFGRGSKLEVFDTEIGCLGLLICFDIFFPELSKYYALSGADIIIACSASPSTSKVFFEKVIPARAIENALFVIYSNLVGTERNMVFFGGSTVVGPRGDVKVKAKDYEEDVVQCEIDLKELEKARQHRPTVRDTRFDVLSKIPEFQGKST